MKMLFFSLLLLGSVTYGCGSKHPYQDPTLPPAERAADLVDRLTLDEKISLMQNNSPAIPRLGIRPYEWWNEALHGVGRSGLATVFPQAIGMGAAFNDTLLYEVFNAVSDEARVKNRQAREQDSYKRYQGLTFWTPNVNIFRDPRWGRGQETYGEDPYLTAQLGTAVVRGLQGPEDALYDKAHACAKHYAVHSGPEWNRHVFNAENIDPRDLWETYLPAFKALVQEAGVKEVMCAYNRYEGDPCCGSDRLLTQILRKEWGFEGIVVSDCWAINDFYTEGHHHTHADAPAASAAAVLSGTDLECGESYKGLAEAVKRGEIDEAAIDQSVRRLMQARFELGGMDESTPWDTLPNSVLNSPEHQQLALRMAEESMVLLQNKHGVLPLRPTQTIALIGPNANDSVMQWGNYNGYPAHTVTLLEALRERLPADRLIYLPACGHTEGGVFNSLFDQCSTAEGKGFEAIYWDNAGQEGEPVATTRQTTAFRFNTEGATAFAPNVPLSNFSAVYRTEFRPTETAPVEFRLMTRGQFSLLIDGQEVAAKKGSVNRTTTVYTLQAKAGQTYRIELDYKHERNTATLHFDLGTNQPADVPQLLKQLQKADVVVFAGGISPSLEGEEMAVNAPGFKGGDRTDIQLPDVQRRLVAALKRGGKKIVFVNYSGSAVGLVPEAANCEAILQAWYPGQAGGTAVANVLFGDYNPAGRLPITFYKDTTQLADFQDYSMKGRTYRYMDQRPLFAFGHGLSYTTFRYGKPQVENGRLVVPVTNAGQRDGEEVVQLYVRRPSDSAGPKKTLRGFRRVAIPAGETRIVAFDLTDDTFLWWDAQSNTVRPLEGSYQLLVGGSSEQTQAVGYDYEG